MSSPHTTWVRLLAVVALGCGAANPLEDIECTEDAFCEDGNPCTRDVCRDNDCAFEVDEALVPDDGIECTVDRCEGERAVHEPDDLRCPDPCEGQVCDVSRGCVDGEPPEIEDDDDPCTEDLCADGRTVHVARVSGDPCQRCVPDDGAAAGFAWTTIEQYEGQPLDDGDPCTADGCEEDPENPGRPRFRHDLVCLEPGSVVVTEFLAIATVGGSEPRVGLRPERRRALGADRGRGGRGVRLRLPLLARRGDRLHVLRHGRRGSEPRARVRRGAPRRAHGRAVGSRRAGEVGSRSRGIGDAPPTFSRSARCGRFAGVGSHGALPCRERESPCGPR